MPFYVLTLIIREGFIYIWNLGQIYRHLRSSPNTRVSSNQKGQIESDSTQKHYSNSRSRFWLVKAGRHLPHLDSWTKCNFHLTGVAMLCGEVPEKAPDGSFPWQGCGWGATTPANAQYTLRCWCSFLSSFFLLAFHSLFTLTYLQFGIFLLKFCNSGGFPLCWAVIFSQLCLAEVGLGLPPQPPPTSLDFEAGCGSAVLRDNNTEVAWIKPLSPSNWRNLNLSFGEIRFYIPTKSAACDSLERWVMGRRRVTGRVEQSHIVELGPLSVFSCLFQDTFSANFLQQSRLSFISVRAMQVLSDQRGDIFHFKCVWSHRRVLFCGTGSHIRRGPGHR